MIVDGASIEPTTIVTEQAQKQEQHEVQVEEKRTLILLCLRPHRSGHLKPRGLAFSFADPPRQVCRRQRMVNPNIHPTKELGRTHGARKRAFAIHPALRGNRAVCAVCLMDFEAPKRRVARSVIRGWSSFGNLLKSGGDGKQDPEKGGGDEGEGKAENAAGTGAG